MEKFKALAANWRNDSSPPAALDRMTLLPLPHRMAPLAAARRQESGLSALLRARASLACTPRLLVTPAPNEKNHSGYTVHTIVAFISHQDLQDVRPRAPSLSLSLTCAWLARGHPAPPPNAQLLLNVTDTQDGKKRTRCKLVLRGKLVLRALPELGWAGVSLFLSMYGATPALP